MHFLVGVPGPEKSTNVVISFEMLVDMPLLHLNATKHKQYKNHLSQDTVCQLPGAHVAEEPLGKLEQPLSFPLCILALPHWLCRTGFAALARHTVLLQALNRQFTDCCKVFKSFRFRAHLLFASQMQNAPDTKSPKGSHFDIARLSGCLVEFPAIQQRFPDQVKDSKHTQFPFPPERIVGATKEINSCLQGTHIHSPNLSSACPSIAHSQLCSIF